jgi:SAM-dependent methyltransferase
MKGDLPKKRRWLLEQLPVESVGVEIGVWKGDFSRWILEIVRPRELHLVDPWTFSLAPRDANTWHGGGSAQGQSDMDAIFQAVAGRFQAETAAGRVQIHRAMSVDAAATFPDRVFDWIYVDGDHYYDSVKADLEAWERTMKPGGLIAGDDYRESPVYGADVIRAVDEFARARGLEVETFGRQYLMRLPS